MALNVPSPAPMKSPLPAEWTGYATAVAGIVLVTGALAPFHSSLSSTTVALAFLLVVLLVAIYSGSRPALVAALLGVAAFNFFFLPPLYTFTIAASQNWVALVAFLVTALTVGQLSARAREKAEEAERQRQEIEQLYSELKAAIDKVSEAEAIRRSEQLKSALLDAVTHDLRTPLTSIKASVTTLLDASETEMETSHEQGATLDEEGQRELLEVINEEADRLNHFIESMVELARIEAGELSLQQRWSSVEDIIASAVQRAAGVTARHHLEVHITEHLPAIRVDAHAVAEVIYTLLDNAAKYAPPGTTIRIGAQHPIELIASEMILLTVEDEGPGIPVELREKVFDKFFRVTAQAAAALPRSNGLGMGLAIARGIVNAHGGRIRVESGHNGKGARFILTLPIGDTET